MTILLDTNAFVWAVSNRSKLTRAAVIALNSQEPKLVSSLTTYELSQKVRVGKLELPVAPSEFVRLGAESLEAGWLAVDFRHTAASDSLPWYHKDPFDRLIALQVLVEDIGLLSSDHDFDRYGIRRIW